MYVHCVVEGEESKERISDESSGTESAVALADDAEMMAAAAAEASDAANSQVGLIDFAVNFCPSYQCKWLPGGPSPKWLMCGAGC